MAKNNDIARRIATLAEKVRPSDSLQARIDNLTPMQAAMYRAYRERYDRWIARHAENLYESLIDENTPPPEMPASLEDKLFPDHSRILEDDSVEVAARKYQALRERTR